MKRRLFFIGFSFFFITSSAQDLAYENLIFEGAGIRGIAYSGVIRELENSGVLDSISRVGGTSAGAITALAVSLGYSADEIYELISETDFQKFNDGGFVRMRKKYGWHKGDAFLNWLEDIIETKTNDSEITFRELHEAGYKDLYAVATCLNRQSLLVFSYDSYPDMKVKDAIRISMSIPFYFHAIFIDSTGKVYKKAEKNVELDIVVDGGIIGNFPIFIFDSLVIDSNKHTRRLANNKTLGVRIDSDMQIINDSINQQLVPVDIDNMSDYIAAFYIIVLENLNRNILIPEDWERTISVSSVGVGPKIKKLSKQQKLNLIRSGEESTRKFLNHEN